MLAVAFGFESCSFDFVLEGFVAVSELFKTTLAFVFEAALESEKALGELLDAETTGGVFHLSFIG